MTDTKDGMPELKAIPGGAPDGCWLPRAVRGVVEALLRRSDLTFEDTSHGRRKSPSPEAQRIEALEAELAALRDSECDKIMAMSETQMNALTRMQGSNPDDVAKIGKMACDLALKDVAIQRLEAELAAAQKDAERMDKLSALMFAADFSYGEDGLNVLVLHWPKNVPVGANLRRNVDAAMAAGDQK